jgi:type I restriction enzyme R subunit
MDLGHEEPAILLTSDFRHGCPTLVTRYAQRMLDAACSWFAATPNRQPLLRPYQVEANTAIEQAIAGRKRQMLVAMATGTGKTFTLVNQAYRLIKSGAARRILFLVDRRALAAQAVNAFASFEPEPGLKFDRIYEVYSQRFRREDLGEDQKFDAKVMPAGYLLDPQPGHAFVYVCTIQRMAINLFGRQAAFEPGDDLGDDEAEQLDIPIHAFDLIVADECHRGYTSAELSLWRNTLDHFDAIKVGLTATPAAHTKAYFTEVVYRYEYERAVREGFLVDFDAVSIKSNVRMSGVFLQEGEQVGLIDPETGSEQLDRLEDERQFDTTEIERKVTAPDSNRKIIEEIKKYALEHEQRYGRFPKTLIFAANDLPHVSHADQLVNLCRDFFLVAHPRRRRQGIQARGLPCRLRPHGSGEPAPNRGRPHPVEPAPRLEHRRPGGVEAEAGGHAGAVHPRKLGEGPRRALSQEPGGHHFDGQARRQGGRAAAGPSARRPDLSSPAAA